MTDEKRPYRKRRRAELEAETRRRIAESAVELHGTVGPSRTSFSAVAERAGVRRSTLYRHFPDEASLFAACSGHWVAANPFPDLARWATILHPDRRLAQALEELYAYYRQTDQMLANLLRDEDTVPAVKQQLRAFRDYLAAARDILVRGRKLRGRARNRVLAATGHALAFPTWRSLTHEQGLDDHQAVELMCALVGASSYSDRQDRRPRARSAADP
jgi:AcrR family transcriptional regulator